MRVGSNIVLRVTKATSLSTGGIGRQQAEGLHRLLILVMGGSKQPRYLSEPAFEVALSSLRGRKSTLS
jgi:hypothetical protein